MSLNVMFPMFSVFQGFLPFNSFHLFHSFRYFSSFSLPSSFLLFYIFLIFPSYASIFPSLMLLFSLLGSNLSIRGGHCSVIRADVAPFDPCICACSNAWLMPHITFSPFPGPFVLQQHWFSPSSASMCPSSLLVFTFFVGFQLFRVFIVSSVFLNLWFF